ncbi:IS4/Tn5 family transposase DNA-binding protein [Acaryochloris marina]|uniref:Transposase Tn5-like N-terminal domain-containing protein n=1 Tax=Acaryochloris marina (strain MBIC 11017) TaxID=329726 RepID=B0C4E3_ACAM1|nr:hypothetical protein [Acaryochloris marina]ABW25688.1 hypothetical protein AM1_0639 [Acaryochloris marina MBIC11017]ABW28687.1 hypothetical protein AM1_3697 [Acaryochloris marina MBIC11017]ABW28849.1 hypothetical protein AM1_3864 [Acaryochloris marina MBIC11017]ABW31203.1 hypothetical protein AM1_6271 [Acaryochloris marina MBIC11017]BDM77680.1 hypothetical protein AM10699_05540 [Acaryochloris marina MBIC10699]
MQTWWKKNFAECQFNDDRRSVVDHQRLTHRALKIGQAISANFGQALLSIFKTATDLKRSYEFSLM